MKLKQIIIPAVLFVLGGAVLSWAYAFSQPTSKPAVEARVASQTVKEPVVLEPTATVDSLFEAVNAERAKVGVAPLKMDARLNRSAQVKADDMTNRNYWGHVDPDGRQGYDIAHEYAPDICSSYASENIFKGGNGQVNWSTNDAVREWTYSKPHYEAMTDAKYVYTGFGISIGGDTIQIVEHFCQP